MKKDSKKLRKKLDRMVKQGSLRRVTVHMGGEYEFAQEMAGDMPISGNALLREAMQNGLIEAIKKHG